MKTIKIVSLVLAVALLLCLAPMPYGYYTFIRFCTMVVAAVWTVVFYNEKKTELAVVCGAVALLFQPFFKIVLGRVVWNVVDVVVALMLIAFTLKHFALRKSAWGIIDHDPVEDTLKYRRIKDELEKELDEMLKDELQNLGFCHLYWASKQRLLKEKYGIEWKSPAELNPNVNFD